MKKENKKKVVIPFAVMLSVGLLSGCSLFGNSGDKPLNPKTNPSVVEDKSSTEKKDNIKDLDLDYTAKEDQEAKDKNNKDVEKKEVKKEEKKENKTSVTKPVKVAQVNTGTNKVNTGTVNIKKPSKSGRVVNRISKHNTSRLVNPSNPSNSTQRGTSNPVTPRKPNKPVKPVKPVTPNKPVTPAKPEVKLVKSEVETVVENKDYIGFMYVVKEDSTLAKGIEIIEKEGTKGYTAYTMKRNKDIYSDGTVKYSDWKVENKKVVSPVSGVKIVGTKEVTPDPDKPEVTVVSTEKESKTENKDYVDFVYDEFEDQNMPKGETKIIEEGKKGYTTYTYTRTKTVYSDGTVKYSNWLESGKKVVEPVNGTKFIGTYEERTLGWQQEPAERVAQDLVAFRASLGLKTNINYSDKVVKWMGTEGGFNHLSEDKNESIAYMMTGHNGEGIVEMWKASKGHKRQISSREEDWYVGAYDNGEYTYYAVYSGNTGKDAEDLNKDKEEPEKPVETPTEPKEDSNKSDKLEVEKIKPVEKVKGANVKAEESKNETVKKVKEDTKSEINAKESKDTKTETKEYNKDEIKVKESKDINTKTKESNKDEIKTEVKIEIAEEK